MNFPNYLFQFVFMSIFVCVAYFQWSIETFRFNWFYCYCFNFMCAYISIDTDHGTIAKKCDRFGWQRCNNCLSSGWCTAAQYHLYQVVSWKFVYFYGPISISISIEHEWKNFTKLSFDLFFSFYFALFSVYNTAQMDGLITVSSIAILSFRFE